MAPAQIFNKQYFLIYLGEKSWADGAWISVHAQVCCPVDRALHQLGGAF